MAIINSTEHHSLNPQEGGTPPLKKKNSHSHEEKKQLLKERLPLTTRDHLDLSKETTTILQLMEEKFFSLLDDFPEYQEHFSSVLNTTHSQERQAIHYLSISKHFLNNPYIKRLASHDLDFASFYLKVKELNHNNESILKDQQSLQKNQAKRYSPYKK